MKSASACCSSAGSPWSSALARASSSRSRHAGGAISQPSRSAGASVFETEPMWNDEVRPQPLQRADRRAVVAVLGVVVVLDASIASRSSRPAQQLRAPLGATARRRSGTGARA